MHGTVECSGDPDWSLFSPVVCGLWLMLPVPALAVATVRLSHARPAKCQTETGAMSMSFQCCRCRGLIVPAEADTGAACRPSPLAHGFLQGSVLASSSYSTVQYSTVRVGGADACLLSECPAAHAPAPSTRTYASALLDVATVEMCRSLLRLPWELGLGSCIVLSMPRHGRDQKRGCACAAEREAPAGQAAEGVRADAPSRSRGWLSFSEPAGGRCLCASGRLPLPPPN